MFTLRCTQRLLTRLTPTQVEEAGPPTTELGDWYANLVYVGRRQLVLAVSERTFLPVVVAAAPIITLVDRIRVETANMLRALNVDPSAVDRELAEMSRVAIGRTTSRQVTGVMVDFAKALDFYPEGQSLHSVSLKLAETPCSPLYKSAISPDRAAQSLFAKSSPPGS